MIQLLPANAEVSMQSEICFSGRNLLNYSEQQMRRIRGKKIGIIFQDAMSAFNPVLTIGRQLTETMRIHHVVTTKQVQRMSCELLAEVGITDPKQWFRSYPHELSGGMRQRAMIAMALAAILIIDRG